MKRILMIFIKFMVTIVDIQYFTCIFLPYLMRMEISAPPANNYSALWRLQGQIYWANATSLAGMQFFAYLQPHLWDHMKAILRIIYKNMKQW